MTGWLDGTPFEAIPGAVAGGLVAGTLMPALGLWVVLQRVVFLGVTLAQIAAAGVALGLVLDLPSLPLGLFVTLGIVTIAGSRRRVTRLGDASLGAGFCVASALALLFISRSAADLDEVRHVLHGNLIYATSDAVTVVAVTLSLGVAVVALFYKELLFATFDAETAAALGLRARGWQLLLFLVLAVALTVSARTTGSLLSFGMLVLPPLAALRLHRGMTATLVLSCGLGFIGTLAGLALAVSADLHVESSIVLSLFLLIPVCAGWRRHPALGLAVAALAVAGGAALEPVREDPHHEHHERATQPDPFHVDVRLEASQPRVGGAIRVGWTAEVHHEHMHEGEPPAVWLLLTGDGLFDQHVLLPDVSALPEGDSTHSGSYLVETRDRVHRVEGQLWSGPAESLDAEPLDPVHALVQGCDVSAH